MYFNRTRNSPSCGSGTGSSAVVKTSGVIGPLGRLARRTTRLDDISDPPFMEMARQSRRSTSSDTDDLHDERTQYQCSAHERRPGGNFAEGQPYPDGR